MEKSKIKGWYFVDTSTGKPVAKEYVRSIITVVENKGKIDSQEMTVGISGDSKDRLGGDVKVEGVRNPVAKIIEEDGKMHIMTANYNEYIAEKKDMLRTSEAKARLEKEEKLRKQQPKKRSISQIESSGLENFDVPAARTFSY